MYGNRVVVTGLGAVTPLGNTPDEFWRNLVAGVSGVDRIRAFDPEGLPVQIAAEVKGFDPGRYMDRKAARRVSRFAQLSIAAAGQALCDARFTVDQS
ncbi:MAG: beta-ketoacyl-[acyl-carrier-protein] synthase II, partial [Chloroflexi bacterium]|nr:beta-ketoacyl-[acyl-carrier-protein] synthase II [Chloroflexota bacterium]